MNTKINFDELCGDLQEDLLQEFYIKGLITVGHNNKELFVYISDKKQKRKIPDSYMGIPIKIKIISNPVVG